MPLNSSNLRFLGANANVKAVEIRARIETCEDFLNFGIQSELDIDRTAIGAITADTTWMTSRFIFEPDFYGSPAPRTEFVSSGVHYRQSGFSQTDWALFHSIEVGSTWIPVHGLCATFKVLDVESLIGGKANVTILSNFHAFEVGGYRAIRRHLENDEAATFALFVDGTKVAHTDRSIHISGCPDKGNLRASGAHKDDPGPHEKGGHLFTRKDHGILHTQEMSPGVHSVGIYVKPKGYVPYGLQTTGGTHGDSNRGIQDAGSLYSPVYTRPEHKHIVVDARTLVVDVQYL